MDNTYKPKVTCIPNDRNKLIIESMPSLKEYKPLWWGRFGRIQTSLSKIYKKSPYKYRREIVSLEDSVHVALDWKESIDMNDTTPIILCLHTLGGDSDSAFIKTFTDNGIKRGYRMVVYNRRGHGGMSLLPTIGDIYKIGKDKIFPRLCDLDDMECVVNHIMAKYPDASKFLVGFSCGANLAVNYISLDDRCKDKFVSCVSISNGYDIHKGVDLLVKNSPICDGVVCQTFKKIIYKDDHLNEIKRLSNGGIGLDINAIINSRSIKKLEELTTILYGFNTLADYHNNESCHLSIHDAKIPLLCLANMSDPLLDNTLLSVPIMASRRNENIITVVTNKGGHIGWIESISREPWYSKVVFEYIAYFTTKLER
jgi:abhydrolase domain-containing protein 2